MIERLWRWLMSDPRKRFPLLIGLAVALIAVGYVLYQGLRVARMLADPRSQAILFWGTGAPETRARLVTVQREACENALFVLPADGYIGLLYADPHGPYSASHPHQGIDIFSQTDPGQTPVYAAYDGYLTRERDWRSAIIIRVPDDPLHPGRQIWLYYTHIADGDGDSFIVEAFPPGTKDVFVEQGTLIGYTGNYNGNALRDVWVHLHFSIVMDDGRGNYTNELEFDNTVDPSRYLGMALNYACAQDRPQCTPDPLCGEAILGAGGG